MPGIPILEGEVHIPEDTQGSPEEPSAEVYLRAIRLNCEVSLWEHVTKGMGYDFIDPSVQDLTDWVQKKWNPLKPKRKNILIQTSRDSFKSTSITQSFPSWCLLKNPNLSVLIISKVYTNAQNFLNSMKERFESDDFKLIFGDWRGRRKWGEDKLIINQRKNNRKEASIMVAGTGTELTSLHFDIIIADDVVTKEDMYSKAAREQSSRLIKQCYDLIDKRKGLLIVVGTCWHEDDEIEKIKRENPKKVADGLIPFETYIRPAERQVEREWKILWPFFTRKILDQIRVDKADIRDYSANYRLMPLPPEAQIFSKFAYFKYSIDNIKNYKAVVMFIDPSLKDTAKADFSAIVSVGKRQDGKIEVFRANLRQRKPSTLLEAMMKEFEYIKQYNPNVFIWMETVQFQEYLKDQAINKALQEDKLLPISGHDQRENKIMRITRIEKYTTSEQVLFREDWETAENGYDIMMRQLKNFPLGDHDDGPDALEGAISRISEIGQDIIRFI